MINIQKFVQVRKKLKLSQTELCQCICTQSTLSKFENNGQVPSFKILKQLCERMDIDVSDIMDNSEHKYIAHILFEADFAFINFDYSKIFTLLSQINPEVDLKRQTNRIHYHYLRGQYALRSDRNQMQCH
ncbi:XRE family transcriptional regulator [Lactobacillus crispatus]|jgi:XRE family transcriptional regulator|nr:XRE family transcriptional regulator [Lactobacillus crispatus]MBI1719826.1 XRE family transcriptional regulator [Lactobacillus crispatus]